MYGYLSSTYLFERRPSLLTPDEGPSLETSIFSFIVSGSEITFTFRVSLNTLPTLATLVRDIYTFPLHFLLGTKFQENS